MCKKLWIWFDFIIEKKVKNKYVKEKVYVKL